MPFLTVDGKRLHYADAQPVSASASASVPAPSPADARTIIFVHGLGSTQNYFFPILPHLRDYRCITFDNYGAGRSKFDHDSHHRRQQETHSVDSIASDVVAILDQLNVSQAIAVGYSMGGMLPTYLASTHPERVLAGVCIGPVHPSEAVAEVFKKRIPAVREGGMEAMANTIPDAATGSKATPLHRAFIREMILAQEVEGYVANCRAIELAKPPNYKDVKVPMLIIAGEEDKSAPLKGCEFILGELGSKSKRLEVLKGVGHWHCVEAADEVGRLVKAFCAGLA